MNPYRNKRNWLFFVKTLILLLVIGWFVSFVFEYLGINLDNPIDELSLVVDVLVSILFAPIIETLLFLQIPYKLLLKIKWLKNSEIKFKRIFYIISSTLFGIGHYYSVWYIIYTFIIGLIFVYYYHTYLKRYNNFSIAFWFTFILHSAYNAVAVFSYRFLE